MPEHSTLGQEIRRLRVASGLTLAELSGRSGMREGYLAAIEADREEPSAAALQRLARQLEPAGARYEDLARLLTAPEFDITGEYADNGHTPPGLPAPPGDDLEADEEPATELEEVEAAAPLATLQLERAEFDGTDGRAPCAICHESLVASYFQINGRTVCPRCCEHLRQHLNAGSGWSRAARATGAGIVAAGAGTILYYAILAVAGVELGLIAIVVGFMVGKAVSWGSNGRGGWKYQTLAMVLTYLSIVTSYLPLIVKEISNDRRATSAQSRVVEQEAAATAPSRPPTIGRALLGIAVLLLFACAVPFLAGIRNIMGLVIIGIGVYEAWKFNRKRVLVITGPHALSPVMTAPGV